MCSEHLGHPATHGRPINESSGDAGAIQNLNSIGRETLRSPRGNGSTARTCSPVIHRDGLELRLRSSSKTIPPSMGMRLSLQQEKIGRTGNTTYLGCQVKAIAV
jgi:hypothetical protein